MEGEKNSSEILNILFKSTVTFFRETRGHDDLTEEWEREKLVRNLEHFIQKYCHLFLGSLVYHPRFGIGIIPFGFDDERKSSSCNGL